MEKKRRERNANFTREETEKLLKLIESRIKVIENKKNDAATCHVKDVAWKSIEADFNTKLGDTFRDAKHLKLKYEALKRDTRRKTNIIAKRYISGEECDAPALTPVEQKVMEMIMMNADGGDGGADSEQLDASEEHDSLAHTDVNVLVKTESFYGTDTTDYEDSNTQHLEDIPLKRSVSLEESAPRSSKQVVVEFSEAPLKKRSERRPSSFKSKENSVVCKTKSSDKLAEARLENVILQKQLIKEEIEEKRIRNQMLKEELDHKSKPKEKKTRNIMADARLENVILQKQLIIEEIEEKKIRNQILKEELVHKSQLFALENKHMILQIEMLRKEVENARE